MTTDGVDAQRRCKDVPNSPALATDVDLTDARAVVVLTAGEAIAQPRLPSVVGIVRRHVTAVTTGVRLHLARAAERARVALQPLLSAPARKVSEYTFCRCLHRVTERSE